MKKLGRIFLVIGAVLLAAPFFYLATAGMLIDVLKAVGHCKFAILTMAATCDGAPTLTPLYSILYSVHFMAGMAFLFGPGWILQVVYFVGLLFGLIFLVPRLRRMTAGTWILAFYLAIPLIPLATHPVFGLKHTLESKKLIPAKKNSTREQAKAHRLDLPAGYTRYTCPTRSFEVYIDVADRAEADGSRPVWRLSEKSARSPLGKLVGSTLDLSESGIPDNPNTPFMKQLRAKGTCLNAEGEPFSELFTDIKFSR